MLALLILMEGNVHKNPIPLSFCHWNLSGMSTDSFLKISLLEAFLCASLRGDIVIYHKTLLLVLLNQDLTKLDETLAFQVKVGTKKSFSHVFIDNYQPKTIPRKMLMILEIK